MVKYIIIISSIILAAHKMSTTKNKSDELVISNEFAEVVSVTIRIAK